MLSLSFMKFRYTLNLAASTAIESQITCLAPCKSSFTLQPRLQLVYSFLQILIFFLELGHLLILYFHFLLQLFYNSLKAFDFSVFKLTCDIAWTISSVFDPAPVVPGTTAAMFDTSTCPCDQSSFSFSSCNTLAL
jgi:hypothetical protein